MISVKIWRLNPVNVGEGGEKYLRRNFDALLF